MRMRLLEACFKALSATLRLVMYSKFELCVRYDEDQSLDSLLGKDFSAGRLKSKISSWYIIKAFRPDGVTIVLL